MSEDITTWLAMLDEGDEVIIESSQAMGDQLILAKVNKITPKGMFSVGNCVQLFDQRGRQRGGSVWNHCRIVPVTEDRIKAIKRRQMEAWLNSAKWSQMSHEAVTVAYMATRARLQWEAEQKEKQQ